MDSADGSGGRNHGGADGDRRRDRAGSGAGPFTAHGPASGAGNVTFHTVAADWTGGAAAILEGWECRFARRNLLRGGNDTWRIYWRKNCSAVANAGAQGIVRRIPDDCGGAAVVQGEAGTGCSGAGESDRRMNRQTLVDAGVLLTGVLGGIASGLFGIGGGVIMVPILGLLLGFSQHRAQGTSLVALIPPTGILAVMAYSKAGYVSWQTGLLLIPGAFLGGILGGNVAKRIPAARMRRIFAVLMVLLGSSQIVSAYRG